MSEYNSYVVSADGQAMGNGVDFLHSASLAFNNAALSHQIREGMKRLRPEIQRIMPARKTSTNKGPSLVGNSGVLVVATFEETEYPDATGNKPKIFKSIQVAGVAAYPEYAIKQFNSRSTLTSYHKGWVDQQIYIWLTP